MTRVYVAGPYTHGGVETNVNNAIDAANKLADFGYEPYVPHLNHFWHIRHPRPYEFWCQLDNSFLPFCDALLRLPGLSEGADAEVKLAKDCGIPVFYSIHEIRMNI
jgi:Domain of unknown function (DUF4406)